MVSLGCFIQLCTLPPFGTPFRRAPAKTEESASTALCSTRSHCIFHTDLFPHCTTISASDHTHPTGVFSLLHKPTGNSTHAVPNISVIEPVPASQKLISVGNCTFCPMGRYYEGPGPSISVDDCVGCPIGQYSDELGTMAAGVSYTRRYWPVGSYHSTAIWYRESGWYDSDPAGGTSSRYQGVKHDGTEAYPDLATSHPDFATNYPLRAANWVYRKIFCKACEAGRHSNWQGASSADRCTACPTGKYLARMGGQSDTQCSLCLTGRYGDETGVASYVPISGYTSCKNCGAGRFNNQEGSTTDDDCAQCPAGQFQNEHASEKCKKCVAGKFSSTEGLTNGNQCTLCPKGKYSASPGQTSEDGCTHW